MRGINSTSLMQGLQREEFRMHYQPRVAVRAGRVSGLEALMRWQHPKLGLTAPDHFIGLAESSGRIADLGLWAIERACNDLLQLSARGIDTRMAVNVSVLQMQDPQFADQVLELIARLGVKPSSLEFELTESQIVSELAHVRRNMLKLRRQGVELSLDDFGTGFSSLTHLDKLPISLVKIDREFVKNIDQRITRRRIVGGVVQMAHGLGLSVVAEGVETDAELAILQQEGCDVVQGFLFSPGLSMAQLPSAIEGLESQLLHMPCAGRA